MHSTEIAGALTAIDRAAPTTEWTIGGVRALPLFRYEIHNRNHSVYQRGAAGYGVVKTRAEQVKDRVKGELDAHVRWARASLSDRAKNERITEHADALLYGDGMAFTTLDGKKYDRFCDPLRTRLERAGASTLMLSPLHEYLVPRFSPSAFVQPLLELARAKATLATRLRPLPAPHLPGFEEALRAHPTLKFPEPAFLARTMVHVEAFAELFEKWLARIQPRVIYVVCYYGGERFAMQLAAKRLGIPTVDLQHGYNGPLHWAYGQWPRPPRGGFEMLPSHFWLWSEDDRPTIDSWAKGSEHRTLVGGNLFAQMWHEGHDEVVKRYDERVRAVLARHPGRAAVLYASNGLESDEQLLALGRIIEQTKGDLFWYPRAHPSRIAEGERLERLLREGGATEFDRANATTLPLYALFRNVDLHVTETSTTVMEAASFGVPTVLWGSGEAAMFPAYIASGMAVPATPDEFPAALRAQLAARPKLKEAHRPTAPADLDQLIRLASC